MATKFTFKKEPRETGLASVGNPNPDTQIKLDKKRVGTIRGPSWSSKDNLWRVMFVVKTDEPEHKHCGWKWVTLKKKFETEPEARLFVNEHFEKMLSLKLHKFEEDE